MTMGIDPLATRGPRTPTPPSGEFVYRIVWRIMPLPNGMLASKAPKPRSDWMSRKQTMALQAHACCFHRVTSHLGPCKMIDMGTALACGTHTSDGLWDNTLRDTISLASEGIAEPMR